jgi:hypothetical protein
MEKIAKTVVSQSKILNPFEAAIMGKKKWQLFDGKTLFSFINFIQNKSNLPEVEKKEWFKKITAFISKNLENQGLIYNRVLGWVYPEDIENAGLVKYQRGNIEYWQIGDINKFKLYSEFKKKKEQAEFSEMLGEKKVEELKQEDEEYLQSLIGGKNGQPEF